MTAPQPRPYAHRDDALSTIADALAEYEIAAALAERKHPDNLGARLLAAHKLARLKLAVAACARPTLSMETDTP